MNLILSCVILSGCLEAQYPNVKFYAVDLTNHVCASYALLDREKLLFKHIEDIPLEAGGPCDGLIGHGHEDFNLQVKPWIRDMIQRLKNLKTNG